jgi:hypothetical protein
LLFLRGVWFSLLAGPDHIGVMLSPVLGVALDHWSLDDQEPLAGPKWNGRDTYFVYYAYASKPEPLTFSFDLKVSKNYCLPYLLENILRELALHLTVLQETWD